MGETDKKASSLLSSSSASAIIIPDDIRSRYSGTLTFWLNGVRQQITNPSPSMKLIEYLRTVARLSGTKLGCGEGMHVISVLISGGSRLMADNG